MEERLVRFIVQNEQKVEGVLFYLPRQEDYKSLNGWFKKVITGEGSAREKIETIGAKFQKGSFVRGTVALDDNSTITDLNLPVVIPKGANGEYFDELMEPGITLPEYYNEPCGKGYEKNMKLVILSKITEEQVDELSSYVKTKERQLAVYPSSLAVALDPGIKGRIEYHSFSNSRYEFFFSARCETKTFDYGFQDISYCFSLKPQQNKSQLTFSVRRWSFFDKTSMGWKNYYGSYNCSDIDALNALAGCIETGNQL